MVSFSHLDRGTPAQTWDRAGLGALPLLDPAVLPGPGEKLVVLAAHPDDETLGAGGLIQQALRRGAEVQVLVCSAGEASHPDSATHRPEELARIRHGELEHALNRLGEGPHASRLSWRILGYPDGQLAAAVSSIRREVIEAVGASGNVLAATYRADGHTDHEALGTLASQIAHEQGLELLEFPLWYWHWADPADDARWRHWHRLELSAEQWQAKARAMSSHRSQVAALSPHPGDEVLLSPEFTAHFERAWEIFRHTPAGLRSGSEAEEVFEALYRQREDPWDYRTSAYEQRKRAVLLASLTHARYRSVLELGCSIGVLSAALAARAEAFLGLDASATALRQAARELVDYPHATVQQAALPAQWPELNADSQDLVVCSEIGYFLAPDELTELLGQCARVLAPDGDLVLCHWLHPIEGWPLDGEKVHHMAREMGWQPAVLHREKDFLLEIYRRPAGAHA